MVNKNVFFVVVFVGKYEHSVLFTTLSNTWWNLTCLQDSRANPKTPQSVLGVSYGMQEMFASYQRINIFHLKCLSIHLNNYYVPIGPCTAEGKNIICPVIYIMSWQTHNQKREG